MKNTLLPTTLFIILGLLSSIPSLSHASSAMSYPVIQLAQADDKKLNAAVQSIKQETGGRILSTKTINKNDQRVYKIKVLLPSGRVKTFTVKAQ